MAIPVAGLIAAAAVPELFKIGQGIAYGQQSRKYAKTPRPKYEIPQSIKNYLAQTKFRAGAVTLPGQGQIEAKMGRQMASSARGIQESGQSSGAILQALAGLNQQGIQQQADLGVQGAQMQDRRMGDLYGAQMAMAEQELAQFDWDKRRPYLDAMTTAAELQKASREGIYYGTEGLSKIFASGLMLGAENEALDGGASNRTTGVSSATGVPFATNFDPNAVYGTGASKPMEEYGNDEYDIQFPNEITNGFNSQYYGMDINDEMSDYYGLGDMYSRTLNNIFRRRGSTRTRSAKRVIR